MRRPAGPRPRWRSKLHILHQQDHRNRKPQAGFSGCGNVMALTRKWELSWARGSGPWPLWLWQGPGVRYGSGGWGLGWCAGVGFGDAGEGDVEAEGAELADVVGDLAAQVGAAFVVVRAEVLISRAGVG